MKFSSIAKKIAYLGVFAAMAVILNIFTVPNTPIGTISFVYVPCILAGIILGPAMAFVVGVTGDFLGHVISPKGPTISISILLASGLIGLIAGFVFRLIKKDRLIVKMVVIYFSVLFICTLGFSSVGNYVVSGALQNKYLTFWEYLLISRLPRQPFILLANCVITYSLVKLLYRQKYFKLILKGAEVR